MVNLPSFLPLNLTNKTVLVRVDCNVPVQEGVISDATRLEAILPTLKKLIEKEAKIVLLSHRGRPKGNANTDLSLSLIAPVLSDLLNITVSFYPKTIGPKTQKAIKKLNGGEILLLENLRFYSGEEENDPDFAKELAALGDLYINDAFSVSHRKHASIEAITHLLPSYTGLLLKKEITHLTSVLSEKNRPLMAIIGGAKVSTKIDLLEMLIKKVDFLALGGGIANTFLWAQGYEIGHSLCEKDQSPLAQTILTQAKKIGCNILLPTDTIVAEDLSTPSSIQQKSLSDIRPSESIFDIGPQTIGLINEALSHVHTVIWNGPVGFFEQSPYDEGTKQIAHTIARLTKSGKLQSLAGGGETIDAIKKAKVENNFTYLSTGGGAFLEYIEGRPLPGIQALLNPPFAR